MRLLQKNYLLGLVRRLLLLAVWSLVLDVRVVLVAMLRATTTYPKMLRLLAISSLNRN
jgi:hypothetical protein